MIEARQLFQRRLATVDERYPDDSQHERDRIRMELTRMLKLINAEIPQDGYHGTF